MTSQAPKSSVAVSAPGKVLLAGGYLVTDRSHSGLVLGLSARIHVHVQGLRTSQGVLLNEVIVRSPQFRNAEWRYGYRLLESNGGVEILQLKGNTSQQISRNKFIEVALAYVLAYVSSNHALELVPLDITILADSSYYSRSETWTPCPGNPESPFLDFNAQLTEAHKTGLGSSAALVTAFISAVLGYYHRITEETSLPLTFQACAHNLAQVAHCAAQGKIGSGFDVAAAVYGSCIYRRFSPSILERVGEVGLSGFATKLKSVVDDQLPQPGWDAQIDRSTLKFPKRLRLVMCDVDCGSETPSMVREVMNWRKEAPEEALLLWQTIQQGTDELVFELKKLHQDPKTPLDNLRDIIATNRSLVREMSAKAGVPIEPRVQTELIDACSCIDGVVGGVVPGAGGYDAIALVIEDREDILENLKECLENYKSLETDAGDVKIGRVDLLGVNEETQGLKKESNQQYAGWI